MNRTTLALLTILATASPAAAAQWWVILGSIPQDRIDLMDSMRKQVDAKAARCGYTTFNDFSAKFQGFTPGLNVYVAGPYPNRTQALANRGKLLPCFPDAYAKEGQYAGE